MNPSNGARFVSLTFRGLIPPTWVDTIVWPEREGRSARCAWEWSCLLVLGSELRVNGRGEQEHQKPTLADLRRSDESMTGYQDQLPLS